MTTKSTTLIAFVLASLLAVNVQADTTWTGGEPVDNLWSTVGNWSDGIPDEADWVKIRNGLPGPTLVGDAVADRVHIGYSEGGALTVHGGNLVIVDTGDDLLLGKNGGSGILTMINGSISVHRDLEVAGGDPGTINMIGGKLIVGDDFEVPESQDDLDSTAEVNLDGGTIVLDGSYENNSIFRMYERGAMDVQGGTLILPDDEVSRVQGFIDNGWITAYKEYGGGQLQLDYDTTNAGKTTLKAVHPLDPTPIDGGAVGAGQVQLSWILPDPCVPGQPVPVDVYLTDDYLALKHFINPASIQVISQGNATSHTVTVEGQKQYFWAVDTYVGGPADPVFGPIFSFVTGNQPPNVDIAPSPRAAWLPDGNEVSLDATITDDATANPTKTWSVVSEPNANTAIIDSPNTEDTLVTFKELGVYVLKLEADDGEAIDNIGSAEITIEVFEDSCEAAQSLPDYVPIPGDLDDDCKLDFLDFAIFAAGWLDCVALDCSQ